MDLFQEVTREEKQNRQFKELKSHEALSPARGILQEISSSINDKDGNFVEQFQTTGFYPRLWEIFLHPFFAENEIQIIDKYDRPDFHLVKNGVEFFVEACSSNPADDDKFTDEHINASLKKMDLQVESELIEYYSMKVGSILFSKIKKGYWNLDWVKGKPFLLALKPSHNKLAHFFPDYKTIEYLYGRWYKGTITEDGKVIVSSGTMKEHSYGEKKIPSGFFDQDGAENISAVIFANTCDIQKFNRMGQQGNHKGERLIISRSVSYFNEIPDEPPKYFKYYVKKSSPVETWSEGVSIFHNPKAKFPLNKEMFKGVRQLWVDEDGKFDGEMPEFFPYQSLTLSMYLGPEGPTIYSEY